MIFSKKNKNEDSATDKLIRLAKKRFHRELETETDNRREARDDLQFKLGGLNQWPEAIRKQRAPGGKQKRPMYTINDVPQFTNQITGDARQNKIAIKISPSGQGATEELAQKRAGLIRDIEKQSHAQMSYQHGLEQAVDCGRGAWKIVKEYESDDVFNMVLRIKRIANPFSVYFDNAKLLEDPFGREQRWCFETEVISREDFEEAYPEKEPMEWSGGLGDLDKEWCYDEEGVRIAKYWTREPKDKEVYLLDDGRIVDSEQWDQIKDDLEANERTFHRDTDGNIIPGPEEEDSMAVEGTTGVMNKVPEILKTRKVTVHEVNMYVIDGHQILSGPHKWEGKYIPIIPVWGPEIIIDNERYTRGLIRNLKDPSKLYNYERTTETERLEVAPKGVPLFTNDQLKGHRDLWDSEDVYRYMTYNHIEGQPPPIFPPPPQPGLGNITATQQSTAEKHSTTGLYPPSLGQRSNEASGKAIIARERQGDTGSFEYHDNLSWSIQYTGEQLNDLIGKIYDTERQIVVAGEDDSEEMVFINQEVEDKATDTKVIINDMKQGIYSTTVTIGPSYSTQRQETVDNLATLSDKIPVIGQVGGDLIVKNLDFVGSDDLVERIQRVYKAQGIIKDKERDEERKNQPPSPEQIAAQLDIKKKELDVQKAQADFGKKQVELQQEVLELKKMMSEMGQNMQQIAQGAALGAVKQILEQMGEGQAVQ